MSRSTFILFLLLFALHIHPSVGQTTGAPDRIPFQGFLTDSGGNPIADGTYPMSFRLYINAASGAPIWTEAHTGAKEIQVTNGAFSVDLGTITSLAGIEFKGNLYLGISVGSDPEIAPRTLLGSAPYALSMRDIYSKDDKVTISAQVGVGTTPTNRELTVNDTDGNGDAVMNLTATNRELVVGVNQSTGGLIQMRTNNSLNLGTNSAYHLTIRTDGDTHVHENLLIGTTARRGMITMRGPNDVEDGPVLYMFGDGPDQVQSGRIRFVEGTSSTNWRGAFIHYDGAANALHIGTHNTSDKDPTDDLNAISIDRSSRNVTVSKDLTVAEDLTVQGDLVANGSVLTPTPIAMGSVDADNEVLLGATPNVVNLDYQFGQWSIVLDEPCTSSEQLSASTVMTVTMKWSGVDDISVFPFCTSNSTVCTGSLSTCSLYRVETKNAFGAARINYSFVVFSM